ncbi:MAG: type II toxin-antitoxin system VapC family toxin [Pseudomonadota bacterium]|nr:type II toxin-antitoxin system VapC family toxin [Pseudomonadota bacterium]
MLVDTDVLIWYLRGHEKAARFLESLQELKLSAITWMELVQGCRNRQELERLKKDFSRRQVVILPVSEAISERAIALVETHFLGDGLLLADALIASTAIEHTLTLSSANSKHFRPIQGLVLQAFEP